MQQTGKLENERELLRKAVRNPEALALLYEYYFPRIFNYIFCRVGTRDTADDLTSIVFEKALKNMAAYSSERAQISTWLFTIAKNTITDYFREQKKQSWLQGKMMETIPFNTDDLETTIVANEDKARLLKAIGELSDRERSIIGLKFWAGLKNRDIASMVNESESNVAVILYRTVKRLKVLIRENNESI